MQEVKPIPQPGRDTVGVTLLIDRPILDRLRNLAQFRQFRRIEEAETHRALPE